MKPNIQGGVVIDGNGNQNVYLAGSSAKLNVTDVLYNKGIAAHIGITYGASVPTAGYIFTTNYNATNDTDTVHPVTYFYSDNTSYLVDEHNTTSSPTHEAILKATSSDVAVGTLSWEYELNNSGSYMPVTLPAGKSVLDLTYNGTDKVTNVRASFNNPTNNESGVISTDTSGGNLPFQFISGSDGSTTFNGLQNVGSYCFTTNQTLVPEFFSYYITNATLTIRILPKKVAVTIDNKSSTYGDTFKPLTCYDSTDPSKTDVTSTYGVTLEKDYGFAVGSYQIKGTGATNKNYEVTIENVGTYTITKRDVTVILNEAQFEYGAASIAVSQDKNATANADGKYIGGWRYDTSSKEFISADLTTSKKPFKLSSTTEYTATQSAVSGFVFPVTTGTYTVTTSDLNPNYKITFKRDGDATIPTGKLTITPAKITVDPDATHGNASVYELHEVGTGKKLEIPAANIHVKAGQTTTITYADYVFDSNDSKATAPANAPELDTTVNPNVYKWQDGKWNDSNLAGTAVGNWKGTSGTELTKTTAGTYKAYFKISAANHEDKIVAWTLTINAKSVSITLRGEKQDGTNWAALTATNKAAYGDTVRAAIDLDAITDTTVDKTKLTNFKIYYKGTDGGNNAYPDTTGVTFDGDGYNSDKSMHSTYGSTTAPKNAGSYTATLVKNGGDYSYTGTTSCSITIDQKEISTPPSFTGTKTYTGAEQSFTIGGFNYNELKLGTLPTGMTDKNSTFTTENAASRALEATKAGEYTVPFSIKDSVNCKWASSVTTNASGEYELKLTIGKAPLKVSFTSPAENAGNAASWLWKPGDYSTGSYITYTIDQTSVMPATGTKENVTVQLYWCKKPESGAAVFDRTGVDQDDNGNDRLDIAEFKKGNYFVVAQLASGNTVNDNYEIKVDETSKLPTTADGTNKRSFEVGDGTASLAGIKWNYEYTLNGEKKTAEYDAANTKITYQLNNANNGGGAVEYTFAIDESTLPEYIIVNVDYKKDDGFTAGYKDAKYTNATAAGTKYKTIVSFTIKEKDDNGEPYTIIFDKNDTTTAGYTWISDTVCTFEIEWTIEKAKVDLSKVEWGYTVDGDYEEDGVTLKVHDFRTINTAAPGDDPVYKYEVDVHGVNQITPVIKADSFDANIISLGSYTGSGVAGDIVDGISAGLTTNMQFTLANTNFEFGTDLGKVTLNWEVTKATLAEDSTWDPTDGYLTDSDGKKYKTPVLTSATDPNISDKVEYVYEYSGKTYRGVEGLKELYKEADALNGGAGGALSGVTVKAEPKSDYQKNAAKEATGGYTETATIGDSRRRVEVKASATSGVYSEASLEITLLRKDNNQDVTSTLSPKIYVYSADADGKLDETTKKPYSAGDLKTMNAGKYFIGIEVDNPNYILIAGQETFAYEITKIELALPTLDSNPIFNGSNIEIESKLKFAEGVKDLVVITGQGSAGNGVRNVQDGAYTLTITLTEEAAKNYKWKDADSVTGTKFTLTADSAPDIRKDSDSTVKIDWRITPLVLNIKQEDWNLKGKTPVLNLSKYISEGVNVSVEYSYYANESDTEPQDIELKGGSSVWVAASLKGLDAGESTDEAQGYRNVILANDAQTTPKVSFTVQQSGVKAALGSALNWAKSNWWILVAIAAALIFLIILICIIKHRKKTKEAREEKKEKKEEEKRRREAEREAARAKQEAELELAKAKQEAELAKIRAAAGAAGMAGMAMQQQQPQQQAMPQQQQPQVQMQQPQQQPQMQMQQYPQQQQMPQQMPMMPMPQQMPMQQQMQSNSGNNYDNGELRELKSEIANMRAEQRSDRELAEMRREMELGFAKFRAENGMPNNNGMNGFANMGNNPNLNNADMLGAVLASMVRNLATGKPVELKPELELPHSVEESKPVTISAPTAYPADAVITTTTTVDTTNRAKEQPQTNPQPRALKREPRTNRSQNNGMFDIDGFYDAFDENK
ncbi:MAG: hypothetical protein K2G38_06960 [Clostridia bacterium]|nr:hypothetical protein [Clostridia bacterium]